MLKSLLIKNIALIESVLIDFTDGLNVLSGETGAGKSVIIDSLNFVLGAKAEKTMIRTGENECSVKAEFDVSNNSAVFDVLDELDVEREDALIINRRFTIDGKSTIKVNGNTVTASMLKKLTSILVDVHGQSEHFYLLNVTNQLALIDKFGGEKVEKLKYQLKTDYLEYKKVLSELKTFGGDESQRLMRLDVLNYQINEIITADIKDNEEEELLTIKEKLRNQEKIISSLNAVKSAISGEGGVSDVLANATRIFSSVSELSENYKKLYERLSSAYSELDDISDEASSEIDDFDFSEYNPDEIEDRLSLIKSLKKKYGGDYEEILSFLEKAQEERNKLENFNELAKDLSDKKLEIEKRLFDKYLSLSKIRRELSSEFKSNVLSELRELKMSKAQFNVKFGDLISFEECKFDSANGIDEIEFEFSANLGEPLKPLSKVISGGEMSRFMLAIKAQTAKYNDIETFIFDEIDAGISGTVAKVVAEKFAKISSSVQVIAISHLPQISAMADNNLYIEKTENENSTITNVVTLDKNEKVLEIIRLVGGEVNSISAKTHAEEMILAAEEYKKTI